ncbi:MAG: BrnA antitoxin family protein [Desulfobacterales bacterium]|nr:BrnA antitoxin family protein [Desulfobacterales bacterium]
MPKLKKGTILPTKEEDRQINAGIAADPDTFEVTDEMFTKARPVSEVHPEIPLRVRGPQTKPIKQSTTIRLDNEVLEYFKAQGKGWQTKINDILHEYVNSRHAA